MLSPLILLSLLSTLVSADVITSLKDGTIYNGKTSGTRYLSLLGDTDNKLISTSFASLGQCPEELNLGDPCVTFKLAPEGQLDDMDGHPGASDRQRNFVGSPDLDDDSNTVTWNMMLQQASAQPGFFHLAQIIGDGGPSWTMSIAQKDAGDLVAIIDATVPDGQDGICDSMSLASFMSAPMAISVTLNRTLQSLHWAVTNLRTKKTVMTCHRSPGSAGITRNSSVQGGAYRRVLDDGLTKSAVAMIGNFGVSKGSNGRLMKARSTPVDKALA